MAIHKKIKLLLVPLFVIVLGLVAGLGLTMKFPPVIGLGSLVRLPVFHGALVWTNFALFLILGFVGLFAYFLKSEKLYTWSRALRYSSIGLWIINFGIGLFASSLTWDFSASSQPTVMYMMQEPRVQMQFFVSLFGVAILVMPLIFEKWSTLALWDGIFGFVSLISARLAVMLGSSLHPPSPAATADEAIIRYTFFGITFALIVMASGIVVFVRTLILEKSGKKAK